MDCIRPFVVKQPGKVAVEVPCGRCRLCRAARQREWVVRMSHERSAWTDCQFATLTYRNDNLPSNESLSKRDVQLFLKRLRKSIYPRKMKYFICGEYGGEYGRPHYHAIFFGISKLDEKLVYDAWQNGFIDMKPFNDKRAKYALKYLFKQLNGALADYLFDGKEQPFKLSSNGLGLDFVRKNSQVLIDNLGIRWNGKLIGLPRYYRDKLGLDKSMFVPGALERDRVLQEYLTKHNMSIVDYRKQKLRNFIAKNGRQVGEAKLVSIHQAALRDKARQWKEYELKYFPREEIPF